MKLEPTLKKSIIRINNRRKKKLVKIRVERCYRKAMVFLAKRAALHQNRFLVLELEVLERENFVEANHALWDSHDTLYNGAESRMIEPHQEEHPLHCTLLQNMVEKYGKRYTDTVLNKFRNQSAEEIFSFDKFMEEHKN